MAEEPKDHKHENDQAQHDNAGPVTVRFQSENVTARLFCSIVYIDIARPEHDALNSSLKR